MKFPDDILCSEVYVSDVNIVAPAFISLLVSNGSTLLLLIYFCLYIWTAFIIGHMYLDLALLSNLEVSAYCLCLTWLLIW